MAVGEDLRQRIRSADERIVLGYAPVVAQPKYFSGVAAQALGAKPYQRIVGQDAHVAIADGQVQQAVWPEEDAAAKRTATARRPASGLPGIGDEDIAHIGERSAVEAAARQRERDAALAVLRVRQVDELIASRKPDAAPRRSSRR